MVADSLEVHDEAGDVLGDVDLAQPRIELVAADDRQPLVEDDVRSAQVTVPVADEAGIGARCDPRGRA